MTEIEAALVDLDGTVYRGDQLVPGTADAIETLEARGIVPLFLSNNATKRPIEYRRKLSSLGIDVPSERILNSAAVSSEYLAARHPTDSVYVIGESSLIAELEAGGVRVTTDPTSAAVLLLSMDRSFDYETLKDALIAAETGDPAIYATNPDRTIPVEEGLVPECGAIIGAVEGMLGRDIDRVLGKPSRVTIGVALDRLGVEPEACLVVGDRLDTDVSMGIGAGMRTALVCSGVTDRADVDAADVRPDHVIDSLADVARVLD